MLSFRGFRVLALLLAGPAVAGAQTRLLDDFESISAWTTSPSDGVQTTIASDSGYRGRGMRLDVDFRGGGGWALVRRALPLRHCPRGARQP